MKIKSIPDNLSDDINIINSLQVNDIISQCDSFNNLINLENDDDGDVDPLSLVDSKYYDIDQLNSLELDVPSSFGLLHLNIASLDKHFDDLRLVLSKLNYKFDIIGISEHKIFKDSSPSVNINLAGYNEFIFEPTETSHGGTGFYVKKDTDYITREDLQINSPSNYESMFIEICFPNKKNLIVGCIYSVKPRYCPLLGIILASLHINSPRVTRNESFFLLLLLQLIRVQLTK